MQDNRPDVITLPPLILAATIALGPMLNFFWPASFLPGALAAPLGSPRRHRPRDFGDPGDVCGEYARRRPQTLDRDCYLGGLSKEPNSHLVVREDFRRV
jgi:hypothetical protein